MFLTPEELNIVAADADNAFSASCATHITIFFNAWPEGNTPDRDDVYDVNDTVDGEEEFSVAKQPSFIQLRSHLKQRYPDFAEVDRLDAVFYFSSSMRFDNLKSGYVIRKNSYRFVDASGVQWLPQISNIHEYERLLRVLIGEEKLMVVVPCLIR